MKEELYVANISFYKGKDRSIIVDGYEKKEILEKIPAAKDRGEKIIILEDCIIDISVVNCITFDTYPVPRASKYI